ncbi:hypothetical protein ACVIWU_006673 [Bradyrhizobium sp. USDA 4509]
MKTPSSPHFNPVDLTHHYNAGREELAGADRQGGNDMASDELRGLQALRGIPFLFGSDVGPNVLVLRPGNAAAEIALAPTGATYVIFAHLVADRPLATPLGFGTIGPTTTPAQGNEVGELVSTYSLQYADGSETNIPIRRRIEIQQSHVSWGSHPFGAVPAAWPSVYATHYEDVALGRAPILGFGHAEQRTWRYSGGENLWLYALPNPHPQKAITALRLRAEHEVSLVYAMSTTMLHDHPLRLPTRRKVRMRLPTGVRLNRLGELDTDHRGNQIGMDLGVVISARAVLEYSRSDWLGDRHDVQPVRSDNEVIVEYAGHPDARLYLRSDDGSLHMQEVRSLVASHAVACVPLDAVAIEPATRPVKLRIIEKATGLLVPARLHVHGQHGEYLPPKGHQRKVNTGRFEDVYAEFANGLNQYAYVDGECTLDLPLGPVFIEITRGFEMPPMRRVVEINAITQTLTFELEKVLHWRERGWVSADTHVHFLSPQTALLEGKAEGVNVVNLLSSQWGEMFSNVGDFDGRTTLGAKDFGGDGEFLVRVGTENRMQVLGHISLLGYEGAIIDPLCTGGPAESAIGDAQETTIAEWAERCRQQGGLVVLPHLPEPQAEYAADIVLGLIDAVEMMTLNPRWEQINAFGLAEWYRYLNIGYHLPLVAGSDKMTPSALLGGIRTYAHLGDQEFTYRNWMGAVRGGDTFITIGPLIAMTVEGLRPGSKLQLAPSGGTVTVDWLVESVSVPPERIEIIRSGVVVDEVLCDKLSCRGHVGVQVTETCWIAIRVRGSILERDGDIAAHTSAVCVYVGDKPMFATTDAVAVLAQIEGSIAYLDTLAPRSDEARHARLRSALQLAHHRLHHRLHELGADHAHTPVHSVHIEREH